MASLDEMVCFCERHFLFSGWLAKVSRHFLKDKIRDIHVSEDSDKWGKLRTKCKGPWMNTPPMSYYLVDYLGMGSTSKAYWALSHDMYNKCCDDKIVLGKKCFSRETRIP
jgi:hypothetical protein